MNYIEACKALVDGERVRKKSWDKGDYIYFKNDNLYARDGYEIDITISDKREMDADSWEIYQTEEEKLIQAGKRWMIVTACFRCKSCTECDREQKELHKVCHRQTYGTLRDKINKLSDSEVNKLYNTLKGEI